MASQSEPMRALHRRLHRLELNKDANNARIRAALLLAIIEGADRNEVERMARAVGLHIDDEERGDAAEE